MDKYKSTPAPNGFPFPTSHNYVCMTCGYEITSWSHPLEHKKKQIRTFFVNNIKYEQEYEISCGRFEEFSKKIET